MSVLTLMGLLLWVLSAGAQPVSRFVNTNVFAFDERGNVTATTNAVGGITLMGYDELNNKTNEVLFLDGAPYATNRWAYDTNGLVRATYNALHQRHRFEYDNHGNLVWQEDPLGK